MSAVTNKVAHMVGVCGIVLGGLGATVSATALVAAPSGQNASALQVHAATVADDTSARAIVIHKSVGDPNAAQKGDLTGTTADDPKAAEDDKIAGVTFTATPITKTAGQQLNAADTKTYTKKDGATPVSAVTDSKGEATIALGTGKAVDGYYLVEEADNPAVKTKTPAFIVHVPLTVKDAKGTQGISYDVNVYPKNELEATALDMSPEKTFKSGGKTHSLKAGAIETWNLTMNRPADVKQTTGDGEAYAKQITLSDPLKTDALTYQGVAGTIVVPDVTDATATELKEGADFTVSQSTKDDYTVQTITLTEAGIKKFGDAPTNAQLNFALSATVNNTSNAKISNTFDTYYVGTTTSTPKHETTVPGGKTDTTNDPKDPVLPKDDNGDEHTPTIKMGNIDVLKTDDAKKPLADATFTLYEDKDAKTPVTEADGKTVVKVTTDKEGKAEITGLEVDPTSGQKTYYLVETDAPAGYDLNTDVHEVTATDDTEVDATVVDEDNVLPNLPVTGSTAKLIYLGVISLAVVVIGSAMVISQKRRAEGKA